MTNPAGLRSPEGHADGVMRRLALRHFWDLRSIARIDGRTGRPNYELLNSDKVVGRLFPRIEEIRITAWLRFGNAVRQLRNALFAAERYRARTISLPPHPYFSGDGFGRLRLEWSDASPDQSLALAGLFFHHGPLRLYGPLHNEPRLLVQYIRPMLSERIATADPRVRPDDLVVHFRAGDIFTRPNSRYGQPPLAYYLGAIERERADRVWLVAEDRGNPCMEAVEAALRAQGVEVICQSASLEEDLRVLLSARRLVLSLGTFTSTAAALSSNLRKAYIFDTSPTLKRLGIHVVRGRDLRGDFDRAILRKNWCASPEQLAMLVDYPREAIGFTDMPSTWWRRNLWDSA